MDRDGDPDFDVGVAGGMLGRGDGSFVAEPTAMPAPPAGTTFLGPGFPGDFDGDGDVDLVVSHYQDATFLAMRLLLNTGGGGFVDGGDAGPAGVDFNVSTLELDSPARSLAADVNGDGHLDLVTLKLHHTGTLLFYDLWSKVWFNDGTGSFVLGFELPQEAILDVEDLNLDGLPDLLVTHDEIFKVAHRMAVGDGTWTDRVNIHPTMIIYPDIRVEAADLNNDGAPDVAHRISGGALAIVWNDGAGNFPWTGTTFALGADQLDGWGGEFRIHTVDLDGDGWLDLVAGEADEAPRSTLIAYQQTGGGPFDEVVQLVFYPQALVDVDGDGDLDAIQEEGVVRNRQFGGAESGFRLQHGSGTAGGAGLRPTLGASGPFRLGESPVVLLRGAPGGTVGVLGVGTQPGGLPGLPVPGATLWLDPLDPTLVLLTLPVGGPPGAPGEGELEIPVGVTPGLVGKRFHHQFFLVDGGSPNLLTATGGLELEYGP